VTYGLKQEEPKLQDGEKDIKETHELHLESTLIHNILSRLPSVPPSNTPLYQSTCLLLMPRKSPRHTIRQTNQTPPLPIHSPPAPSVVPPLAQPLNLPLEHSTPLRRGNIIHPTTGNRLCPGLLAALNMVEHSRQGLDPHKCWYEGSGAT